MCSLLVCFFFFECRLQTICIISMLASLFACQLSLACLLSALSVAVVRRLRQSVAYVGHLDVFAFVVVATYFKN